MVEVETCGVGGDMWWRWRHEVEVETCGGGGDMWGRWRHVV